MITHSNIHRSFHRRQKGFTLVEMLIVLGIFSSIILLVTSIFLFGIREQQRATGVQEALNQVSFASEFMVRALRLAKKDDGAGCVPMGRSYQVSFQGNAVRFQNALEDEDCQEFYVENEILYYTRGIGTPNSETVSLISEDMRVVGMQFVVDGDGSEEEQPRVTLVMNVAVDAELSHEFHIQTTISQRDIEL